MSKMAAMPIYDKNIKKSSFPEPIDQWPWNLVLPEYYQSCSNYDAGLTLTHFAPRSNLVTSAFVWEKVKIIYFLETVAALGLKVAWSI